MDAENLKTMLNDAVALLSENIREIIKDEVKELAIMNQQAMKDAADQISWKMERLAFKIRNEEAKKVDKEASKVSTATTVEQCAGCMVQITQMLYRDEAGWLCDNCAPPRISCNFRFCRYADIDKKSTKHSENFCQRRNYCFICCTAFTNEEYPIMTLSEHYRNSHKDITYKAGSTWRGSKGSALLTSIAGTAVVSYTVQPEFIYISVMIPVSSERLREYCCKIRLTNPVTGLERTYTPNLMYSAECDWLIKTKDRELTTNKEFDMCVDITRIEPKQ